ncbi:uncharacterized protein LOC129585407 [Paramacrobiotus metropolitanus]|uniref:uncharacterized protein LOC129585407 n=1 Tax=Paramacrobiotus metropolitanus TaxID=2943436 RepID=UPI002445D466|nr:uncharacterized protein LOC129585407 [Paramacrobiotus metropolitanus]
MRYYGTYLQYGTGDTFIDTVHTNGGPKDVLRKWNVECLDGEGVIGIRDNNDDFKRLTVIWCRFLFPYKPQLNGLYPYYSGCIMRNLTTEAFCFSPKNATNTVNTFITGFWDNDAAFVIFRSKGEDAPNTYKCCRTPPGYYIDYTTCLYKPTHDQFWEYYDAQQFLVFCDSGYVLTGLARRKNPYDDDYHLEWLQCCRIGYSGVYIDPLSLSWEINGGVAADLAKARTRRSLGENQFRDYGFYDVSESMMPRFYLNDSNANYDDLLLSSWQMNVNDID